MGNFLVIDKDNKMSILTAYPHMEDEIRAVWAFDTHYDARQALSLVLDESPKQEPSARVAVLEAEIDEYKAINKRLVDRIDGLLAHQQVSMDYANALTTMLRRIMNTLAVGTIEQSTHRERNEVSRNIVNNIISILKTPIDVWANRQIDMDDIPF